MRGDFTTRGEVIDVYRRRAANYDVTANLYYLIGLREYAYRRLAVDALRLKPGDTVVELGCGTGLNFALLEEKVTAKGRIIGVDLTDAMLDVARRRIDGNHWTNVDLVQSAAADYQYPGPVDGILATFALGLEGEYDRTVAEAATALKPGGRFVVLDLKMPENWLRHLAPLLVLLARPFAVSMKIAARRPWESVRRHLRKATVTELYLGIIYLAVGEK